MTRILLLIFLFSFLSDCTNLSSRPIEIREVGVEKLRKDQFVRITYSDGTQYVIELKKVTSEELIGIERGKDKVKYLTSHNDEKKYIISEISKYEIIVGHKKVGDSTMSGASYNFLIGMDALFDL